MVTDWVAGILFFCVAFLYSSVGHGGASGYLAIYSLFFTLYTPSQISTSALVLNLLVAGTSFISFLRERHFSLQLTLPFLLSSIPFAFIGGMIQVSDKTYTFLLAGVLLFAGIRLFFWKPVGTSNATPQNPPKSIVAIPFGGGIGIVSGIVGVGGGIFLSPLILFLRWADPKKTAATSACFILVNSLAGLLGRAARPGIYSTCLYPPYLIAAFLGGLVGSYWGSKRFSGWTLRRILGIVLLISSIKLILTSF